MLVLVDPVRNSRNATESIYDGRFLLTLPVAHRGRFFAFEGIDGSGKSTQVELCIAKLREQGRDVIAVREPGGTALSLAIRELVLDPARSITPTAELMLYMAARAQLVAEVIAPALQRGQVVVSDRFGWSTYAYQGFGRGLDRGMITSLMQAACGDIWPDCMILLDIDPETRRSRLLAQGRTLDRLEREDEAFFARVREGFRALVREAATPAQSFDGADSKMSIADRIQQGLLPFLSASS
jgi:dTMP kinase